MDSDLQNINLGDSQAERYQAERYREMGKDLEAAGSPPKASVSPSKVGPQVSDEFFRSHVLQEPQAVTLSDQAARKKTVLERARQFEGAGDPSRSSPPAQAEGALSRSPSPAQAGVASSRSSPPAQAEGVRRVGTTLSSGSPTPAQPGGAKGVGATPPSRSPRPVTPSLRPLPPAQAVEVRGVGATPQRSPQPAQAEGARREGRVQEIVKKFGGEEASFELAGKLDRDLQKGGKERAKVLAATKADAEVASREADEERAKASPQANAGARAAQIQKDEEYAIKVVEDDHAAWLAQQAKQQEEERLSKEFLERFAKGEI